VHSRALPLQANTKSDYLDNLATTLEMKVDEEKRKLRDTEDAVANIDQLLADKRQKLVDLSSQEALLQQQIQDLQAKHHEIAVSLAAEATNVAVHCATTLAEVTDWAPSPTAAATSNQLDMSNFQDGVESMDHSSTTEAWHNDSWGRSGWTNWWDKPAYRTRNDSAWEWHGNQGNAEERQDYCILDHIRSYWIDLQSSPIISNHIQSH